MKWTLLLLLTHRFPRPLLSAAIVSLHRHLAWEGIATAATLAVGKWILIVDSMQLLVVSSVVAWHISCRQTDRQTDKEGMRQTDTQRQ